MGKTDKKTDLKIEYIDVTKLKPYEKNARKHEEYDISQIAKSIEAYGFNDPIGIWGKDNTIVTGHGRLLAAKKLGMKEVPCIRLDDLTDEQRREYTIMHNKTAELSTWDFDMLEKELSELDFGEFDIDWNIETEKTPDEVVEDVPPEVDEISEPICKRGDIWKLGNHRLVCGDSTDKDTVARLMNGEKADMVFTDPPYNVDYSSKNAFLNEADKGNRIQKDIAGDFGYSDKECGEKLWKPAFQNMRDNAKDDCSIYVTMPQGGAHMVMMMMCSASWQVKHELIWVKNNHVLGRTDYFYKHEPILFGWAKTHKFYGKGEFNKSVWEIDKPSKSELHPTMKPIRLIANALQNSSKENDLIIDFFGGSGSTLIACEQLGRRCFTIELDPKYCGVIIRRWEAFTGKKAEKIN